MNYKTGKWAGQILKLRNNDGMWGNFHTLSKPVNNKSITTEQAFEDCGFWDILKKTSRFKLC